MCGFCGKVSKNGTAVPETLVHAMMSVIEHRGPDGDGVHCEGPVGLGHRRLSIIGLETGRQPLSNEDDTVWVTYNGEIYNFQELREDLVSRGHVFRTTTDTEVIVHLYEEYGDDCVEKLTGMFGFALYDAKRNRTLLARDRTGIKPVYYAETGDSLVFGSEIKSLLQDPAVSREVHEETIDRFFTYDYTPGSDTLLRNVKKLLPGHLATYENGKLSVRRYWELKFPEPSRELSDEEAVQQLDALLRDVVRGHMISDVPVGFLLSGGVDSTALLSLAVGETNDRVSTFTIGFDGEHFADERTYARLAAERFGTDHYETTLAAGTFGDFVPRYVWHMEEPVCEPPAIALYYVSKLAREHVKVVLSGEGGDEAFAGYSNYRNLGWLEQTRRTLGPAAGLLTPLLRVAGAITKSPRIKKYARCSSLPLEEYFLSRTSTPDKWYLQNRESVLTPELLGRCDQAWSQSPTRELFARIPNAPTLHRMLYVDTCSWLPDDLLIKADKITMANSLELRVPLLDHRVLEFAASLPPHFKVRGKESKVLLKRCFEQRVPDEILTRKKAGFPVPYERWLRGDLRELVRDTLLDQQCIGRGYFQKSALEKLLDDNDATGHFSKEVYSLLVLETWHRLFVDREACVAPEVKQTA